MATQPISKTPAPSDAWQEIETIVGVEHLRIAAPADAVCGVQADRVAEPGNAEELANVLSVANAAGLRITARGSGSKLEWGNRPRAVDGVLSTARLNRVLEHAWADMTATVEPGCTVAEFQGELAKHGQRLALDPLFPERATIGGILATNDSGALRGRFGSLRDLLIGVRVALTDGTLARSGGKVVKNVAGYDLPKLFIGSLGTLGVIVEATFRLHPKPKLESTLTFKLASPADANRAILAFLDATLATTGMQVRAGRNLPTLLDLRIEGTSAGIEAQVPRAIKLAGGEEHQDAAAWRARDQLFTRTGTAAILKFSVLPAQLAAVCEDVQRVAAETELDWQIVAQAIGIGLLRLEGTAPRLSAAIEQLRSKLEAAGASLVVLRAPDEVRELIDAWGSAGSALPLMRRVKQEFDPGGILNLGRFVGGI